MPPMNAANRGASGRFAENGSCNSGGTSNTGGSRIEEMSDMGERYIVDSATGEKFIRGSRRPDGTYRKEIRVRPNYVPVEERRAFLTRQQLSRMQVEQNSNKVVGLSGAYSQQKYPVGYSPPVAAVTTGKKNKRATTGGTTATIKSAVCATVAGGINCTAGIGKRVETTSLNVKGSSNINSSDSPHVSALDASIKKTDTDGRVRRLQQQQPQCTDEEAEEEASGGALHEVLGKLRLSNSRGSEVADGIPSKGSEIAAEATSATRGEANVFTADSARRRLRIVKKKLKEVEVLLKREEEGGCLTEEQRQKLQRKEQWETELRELEQFQQQGDHV